MSVYAAPDRERLWELFTRLAAVPSPSKKERKVADLVIQFLEGLGLGVDEDGTATTIGGDAGNLRCRVTGRHFSSRSVLALGAHLDTVQPVDDINPILENGRIRNARPTILGADDKAAVAPMLHATEILVAGGEFPTYELFFTVAEEIGLLGAKHLAVEQLASPIAAVFDSSGPVGGITVRAPTQQTLRATFLGKAAHAGLEPEEGRNAIAAAAWAVAAMQLGRLDESTTSNVGKISGGTANNIVPDRCMVEGECRSHDDERLARAAGAMVDACHQGAAQYGVDVEVSLVTEYRRFSLSQRSAIVRLARSAAARLGLEAQLLSSGGGSDANILNSRGKPTVNMSCGMTRVHTPEESVTLDALEQSTRMILEMIRLAPEYALRRS